MHFLSLGEKKPVAGWIIAKNLAVGWENMGKSP